MKFWYGLFFYFLFTSGCLTAQTSFTLRGKVSLPTQVYPSGNLMLLHPSDSSVITGIFFVEGDFEIQNLQQWPLIVKLTSLEFAERVFLVDQQPTHNLLDLGLIPVESPFWELEAITISGKKPSYRQRPNGTVEIPVANTVLAASNSLAEVLSRTPEIQFDDEGNLSILGKGTATIYLDGQRVLLNQVSTIVPANIESIEIIRNPSAKYDAAGGAIIHIHTQTGQLEGRQLQWLQNAEYSSYAGSKSFSSANVKWAAKRLSIDGFYTFERGRDEFLKITTRDRTDQDIFFSSRVNIRWREFTDQLSRYGMGTQYNFKPGTYVSIAYKGSFQMRGGTIDATNHIIDGQSKGQYESNTDQDVEEQTHLYSYNYQQTLDTLGSFLFIGGQYSTFAENLNNPITESSIEDQSSTQRQLLQQEDRAIDIATAQLDYTQFLSSHLQLEAGLRGSFIQNSSVANFQIAQDDGTYELSKRWSNIFGYQEKVGAAYLSLDGNFTEKWNYQLGLRAEYTDYQIDVNQGASIADQYWKYFPNLMLSYQWSENYRSSLNFSSRMDRQPYNRLNPGLIYQDPYTSIQGNPMLVPQEVRSIESNTQLGLTNLKVGYNYLLKPFGGAALRGADSRTYILKRINFEDQHDWYASISRGFHLGIWSSNNTLSTFYRKNQESVFGVTAGASRVHWYFYSTHQFQLGKTWNVELLFQWQNDLYEGTIHREDVWTTTLSIERFFFDQRLKCRLIANDLFHTNRADGDYSVAETNITFQNKWNSNFWRLSLTYQIGDWKNNGYRHRETGTKENARRL
ncbi:MAG: TonB-dependent receptor [Saprospiraceae bacterium]|nr:TonB-dependent receptor [Saprospiraceae bacterium]